MIINYKTHCPSNNKKDKKTDELSIIVYSVEVVDLTKIALTTRTPSKAALIIPPANPAPSPQG
jgi:hypothetical protein